MAVTIHISLLIALCDTYVHYLHGRKQKQNHNNIKSDYSHMMIFVSLNVCESFKVSHWKIEP